MFKKVIFSLLTLFISTYCSGQDSTFQFLWNSAPEAQESSQPSFLALDNGHLDFSRNGVPYLSALIPIRSNSDSVFIEVLSVSTSSLTSTEQKAVENLSGIKSTPLVVGNIAKSGNKRYLSLSIDGLVQIGQTKAKVEQIHLKWTLLKKNTSLRRVAKKTNSSANLTKGQWYKYAILKTGPQKISYEQLINDGLITGEVPSNKIAVFGSEGTMLPYITNDPRPEELQEIKITVEDNGDNTFSSGDYLLFYAQSGSNIKYQPSLGELQYSNNLYSDTNFVFVRISDETPTRISNVNNNALSESYTSNNSLTGFHHEKDLHNFLASGRMWVGEETNSTKPLQFKVKTSHVGSQNILIKAEAHARATILKDNSMSIIVNGDTLGKMYFSAITTTSYTDYVSSRTYTKEFIATGQELDIQFYYHQTDPNSVAWLDNFTLNYIKENILEDSALFILDTSSYSQAAVFKYEISNCDLTSRVWSIDDYHNVKAYQINIEGTKGSFKCSSAEANQFLVFNPSHCNQPLYISGIEAQQLDYQSANLLIITPPLFKSQAEEIAKIHEIQDNCSTKVVVTEHIYNRYSSGRKEAAAIRNYIKDLYDNSSTKDSLKFVLLMGTGSYDPKNRLQNNLDLVPVYESNNSIKATVSYVTDDFYAVMDDNEGDFKNFDMLDIAVGRLPLRTTNEADIVVEKIKQYYNQYQDKQSNGESYSNYGSWRNNIVFVADDGDNNEHLKQANSLATIVDTSLHNFNITKFYSDQFLKIPSATGQTYPEATKAIINKINSGALIVNYTGHGGEAGWASERLLDFNSIYSMNNKTKLPLVMTATCEFSRFDDPNRLSAGELLCFRKDGGAIALFTTVRVVYSTPNFNLNKQLYFTLSELKAKESITIGELFKQTKIRNNAGTNDRNFTLVGDPALRLMIPSTEATIDSLVKWESVKTDTLNALSQGVFYGHLNDGTGILDDTYNGTVELKIFDQSVTKKTLGNDNKSLMFSYKSQESILFKGNAKVVNGKFECPVIIPKDAISSFGNAKISLYAYNEKTDAKGYSKNYKIGGTDSLAPTDRTGPQITLYLNDTSFSFGDVVPPSPYLIANLSDESGINLIPENFEHNIILSVDYNSNTQIVLNDQYQPANNNYKKGQITLNLDDLKNGKHSLELKASDNYNNQSKQYTEFIIEENAALALEHVLNYPNPFTTNTGFYFEQNQNSGMLNVHIQIFTISGRLIKTILTDVDGSSKLIGPISWDGKDDYGSPIGRGVYLYKITVQREDGNHADHIEKLVILH